MLIYGIIFVSTLAILYLTNNRDDKNIKQFVLPSLINTGVVFFVFTKWGADGFGSIMNNLPTSAPF